LSNRRDHAGAQNRRGRCVALLRNHFKLLARRCVCASQIPSAARDAAGSTGCSCFMFGGVLFSSALLGPSRPCDQTRGQGRPLAMFPVPGRPWCDRRRRHFWALRGRGMIDPGYVARPTKGAATSAAPLSEEAESLRRPAVVVSFSPPRREPIANSAASRSPLPFTRLSRVCPRCRAPCVNSMAAMKVPYRFCSNLERPAE